MKMILHDLTPEQCQAVGITDLPQDQYLLIDSLQMNHYCIGCFGCWLKTPGTCVIKDEFQHQGNRLSKVDELIIISKSSFGSYSSSIKNVLDRSISYVMPFFEIRKGEMHHAERYFNHLNFSAVFYGDDITEAEKETSRNLVKANAVNLNSSIGEVFFVNTSDEIKEILL